MRSHRFVGTCLLAIALAMASPSSSLMAAGTVTVTSAVVAPGVTKYTIAWTSTAGGAVSGNAFVVKPGRLLEIKFVPNTSATQPTDLYDVTLVDTDNVDVLNGRGVDRSNATSSILLWDPPMFRDGLQNLDLVVANAGNAKTGTVILYVGG